MSTGTLTVHEHVYSFWSSADYLFGIRLRDSGGLRGLLWNSYVVNSPSLNKDGGHYLLLSVWANIFRTNQDSWDEQNLQDPDQTLH